MQPTKAPAFGPTAPEAPLWTEFPSLLTIFEVGYSDPSPSLPLTFRSMEADPTGRGASPAFDGQV